MGVTVSECDPLARRDESEVHASSTHDADGFTWELCRYEKFVAVLQCVAVCCSVLQCAAGCCNVLQCVAVAVPMASPGSYVDMKSNL